MDIYGQPVTIVKLVGLNNMKHEYVKTICKGQELGKDFNDFIDDSLMQVTSQKQEGNYPHDIVVRFKKSVKTTITIEEL